MRKTLITGAVAAAVGMTLVGCGQRPDPCTVPGALSAPTQEQLAKIDRGLEVDESIEVDGYEVECVLLRDRAGNPIWVSETND